MDIALTVSAISNDSSALYTSIVLQSKGEHNFQSKFFDPCSSFSILILVAANIQSFFIPT
jgi:hypothetical protein